MLVLKKIYVHCQVQEDENKQKMAACFKANPPSVLEIEPFAPAKSSKPLTGMYRHFRFTREAILEARLN